MLGVKLDTEYQVWSCFCSGSAYRLARPKFWSYTHHNRRGGILGGKYNIMKKIILSFVFILISSLFSLPCYAACTGSSPVWNSSPDYASVSSCVSSASPGDTINVQAGSATWSSELPITKAVSIIGAGIGNTIISGTNRGDYQYLISYSNASNANLFRVSGFTFNITNQRCIYLNNNATLPIQKMIRIDHNRFTNASTTSHSAVNNDGCYGVIDHNTVDSVSYPFSAWGDEGAGTWYWQNVPAVVFGSDNNMYYEDNTISGVTMVVSDSDTGGRYAYRYNTISASGEFWDLHGPGSGGGQSSMGGEFYGNNLNGAYITNQRGARELVFYNNKTTSGGFGMQPEADASYVYPDEAFNNNYYFNNRPQLTGSPSISFNCYCRGVGFVACGTNCGFNWYPNPNVNYWSDNTSCEGSTCSTLSTGVGCGTLANLPANCTVGVGYWATNQSCTNLTGMVGASPTTPISGTLYKCTSTNTWTAYYTPFTYPHPLTTGGGGGGGGGISYLKPNPPLALR